METVAVRSDTSAATSRTEVLSTAEDAPPVLRLRLKKPKGDKKVGWREGTVDNEHMGKKKSKCCCIYKKPVSFGESSSEDDEECENCYGHPEKRKRNRKHGDDAGGESADDHDHDHDHDKDGTCLIRSNPAAHLPEVPTLSE